MLGLFRLVLFYLNKSVKSVLGLYLGYLFTLSSLYQFIILIQKSFL